MSDETTEWATTSSQLRSFTAAELQAIRRQAAELIGVPEEALVPAERRVIIRGDPSRVGTLLFRLVGAKEGVCLVWEDGRNTAVWLYERHVTHFGTAV